MTRRPIDTGRLIATVARALRHAPDDYLLELSPEGWAPIDDLLLALRLDRPRWRGLTWEDVEAAIRQGEPGRFEVAGGRIRAAYGHSIPLAPVREPAAPPETLFHATPLLALPDVLRDGLKPMRRQFVHLTADASYARRLLDPPEGGTILLVLSREANDAGVPFYRANEHVWLVPELPPRFLRPAGAGLAASPLDTAGGDVR